MKRDDKPFLPFIHRRHMVLAALLAVFATATHIAQADYAWVQTVGGAGNGNGQLSSPGGLTFDNSGNLWVADNGAANGWGRVVEFNSAGIYLNQFSQLGAGGPPCGCMVNPGGVAVDSLGNVWVAASPQQSIWEFNSAGVHFNQVGGFGNANGQFEFPGGVAVDSLRNLWVADSQNSRIQEFTAPGSISANSVRQVLATGSS